MSMTSQDQDQGKKTCHTASDSMISGEMDKIWILHSILCDEIRKWEAFSATPPVRLGVGQNDAQKCRGTNTKLQDDLIPQIICCQTKIFSCSIQKNWNQRSVYDNKFGSEDRETWWCDDQHHIFMLSWGGLVAPIANHDLVLRRHFLHSTLHT